MIKEIVVQGGYDSGGYKFNVLDTPSSQTYKAESFEQYQIGRDTYYHGYIKGKEIKEKKLPLDANPRKPSPTKVVRLMQATVQRNPSNFHHLNNGITIIAHSVAYTKENNEVTISFESTGGIHGDGVCNGGHSYFALDQFQGEVSDDVLVRIEVLVLDPELSEYERAEKVKAIAEARNAHNELESITTAHYTGYYDKMIEALGNDKIYFRWFEGDPDATPDAETADNLVAKLAAICPHWYSHHLSPSVSTANHRNAARGPGSVHRRWLNYGLDSADDRNMNYMLPLLKDILYLKDEISHSLLNDTFSRVSSVWKNTRIWQFLVSKGTKQLIFKEGANAPAIGYSLPHTFSTMILGAFRENVWYSVSDEGINLVGWLKDPLKLWHEHKETYMKDLYNIATGINAPSFGNAFLGNPAIYSHQFTRYEFGARLQPAVLQPEIIYDVATFEKHTLCEFSEGQIHLKVESLREDLPPFAQILQQSLEGSSNYKLSI